MKTFITLLIVFATGFIFTNTLHADDLQTGFLGLPWGTDLSKMDGFKKVENKDTVSYYKNPDKAYTIDNLTVRDVVYGAYLRQFFAVYIHADALENYAKIRQYLTAKYGEPNKRSMTMANEQRISSWKDKKVKIKLKYYVVDGKLKLAFYYTPISNALNEAQHEEFINQKYQFLPLDKKPTGGIPLLRF